MVITTHMFNQMITGNGKKFKKDKIPSNPDSAMIKSFLKDSANYEKTEKRVIFSNS